MYRVYVREGDGLVIGIIKFVFLLPLFAVPIVAGVQGWKALGALHLHPALIVLAIVVVIGILIAVVGALSSAMPRGS